MGVLIFYKSMSIYYTDATSINKELDIQNH